MTNETTCPVAPLADEALKLIGAHRAVADAMVTDRDDERRYRYGNMQEIALDFIRATRDRATFLRAESAKGALFQICAVADLVEDLEGMAPPAEGGKVAAQKINRALRSIAAFIESTTGAALEDAGGDYFLSDCACQFSKIDKAIALAEAERKEAA